MDEYPCNNCSVAKRDDNWEPVLPEKATDLSSLEAFDAFNAGWNIAQDKHYGDFRTEIGQTIIVCSYKITGRRK
jgi:hypothetical protein